MFRSEAQSSRSRHARLTPGTARHGPAHRPLRLSGRPGGEEPPTLPHAGTYGRHAAVPPLPTTAFASPLLSPDGRGRTQVRAGRCQAPRRAGLAGCGGGSGWRGRGRAEGGWAQLDRREGVREGGAGGCARLARVSERPGGGRRGEGSGRLRRGAARPRRMAAAGAGRRRSAAPRLTRRGGDTERSPASLRGLAAASPPWRPGRKFWGCR